MKPMYLALALFCLAAVPALAQLTNNPPSAPTTGVTALPVENADGARTDKSGASSAGEDSGQPGTNSASAPAPSKRSLLDLKNEQDKVEQRSEGASNPQVKTRESCTSRDIAASVQMPGKRKFMGYNGFDKDKFDKCESSFEALDDACDITNPCSDCDNAVKMFSNDCGYDGSTSN